jgi:3-deoxy-7-phosphoheptulonate synthase
MHKVLELRHQAKEILQGHCPKKVLIIGPCSIHEPLETLAYAQKLKALAQKVEDKIFIVMRVFLEKPRTSSDWRGYIYDPDLDGSSDLKKGIFLSVQLLKELVALDIPLATEFIDPNLATILEPYITWGFIGARTMRSPIHRQLASNLPMPIGFKNPLDGDLSALCSAIKVANTSHTGLFADDTLCLKFLQTPGNPFCHGVLRGSRQGPNYREANNFQQPVMIDCAHGNSSKTLEGMKQAFVESSKMSAKAPHIIGLMLESFLEQGHQKIEFPLIPGVSITDSCLDWAQTEHLVMNFYRLLSQSQRSVSGSITSSLSSNSSSEILINSL